MFEALIDILIAIQSFWPEILLNPFPDWHTEKADGYEGELEEETQRREAAMARYRETWDERYR